MPLGHQNSISDLDVFRWMPTDNLTKPWEFHIDVRKTVDTKRSIFFWGERATWPDLMNRPQMTGAKIFSKCAERMPKKYVDTWEASYTPSITPPGWHGLNSTRAKEGKVGQLSENELFLLHLVAKKDYQGRLNKGLAEVIMGHNCARADWPAL